MTDSTGPDGHDPERTVAHRPEATASLATVFAPASGRGRPASADDLRQLLRRRLLFFAFLLTAGFAVTAVALVTTDIPLDKWTAATLAMFGLGPVFARVLWVGERLSVSRLRWIELALFGAYYLLWSMVHGLLYPTMKLADPPVWYGVIFGYAVSVPWAFLIIGYGILIPNTWRRCAAVIAVMVVTPLVISVANGFAAQVTGRHGEANFLVMLAFCLIFAAAIAVYGSHRIEGLRREVAAARRLGPYLLGRRLGAGGMGEVYLAEHHLLRRPCAVKRIRADRAGDPESWRRFEREVQTTATLTHPNTVQVYDYGHAEDGTFYYAMEYLPGPTLEELVRRYGPLEPGRVVYLLRQVCGALAEAHAAGLVHRDIKPANVIVCSRGGRTDVAKLLDFGVVLVRGTGDTGVAGTPAYMSSEQAAGLPTADPRSDLYSLGAVAFFLLTGEPPFPRRTVALVLAAHRAEPPAFPASDRNPPDDLKAVVLRCLEKEPADRFPDADTLDRAIAECECDGSWTEATARHWWAERAADGSPRPGE